MRNWVLANQKQKFYVNEIINLVGSDNTIIYQIIKTEETNDSDEEI